MRTSRVVSLLAVTVLLGSLVVGPLLSVGASGQSANFASDTPSDNRGEVIPITVHASKSATVNIWTPGHGFWVQLNVTGGTTTLDLNTYWADDPNKVISLEKGSIRGSPKVTPAAGPLQPGVYNMNITVNGIT
jgi:hypothetical protein